MENVNLQEKVIWSRSIMWNFEDNSINIEGFKYPKIFMKLFPEFYFITQKPITGDEILKNFGSMCDSRIVKDFISDLIKKKILINEIPGIHQLAYSVNNSFENKHGDSIKYNAQDLAVYKHNVLGRDLSKDDSEKIKLDISYKRTEYMIKRRSCRSFEQNKKILFKSFSEFISSLRQTNTNSVQYCYPTAGGLYPIDIYLCVKEDRVEGVHGGTYYYNPKYNIISKISSEIISKKIHYFTNERIYETSAFSIILVYNAECNMPKYNGMGYMFGLIDTGVIVGYLSMIAEQLNFGLCSIGDCNFEMIDKLLHLKKNQICVHCIEIGLKMEEVR